MKKIESSMSLAIKEHLFDGNPITPIEALNLFGINWLHQLLTTLRREGYVVNSRVTSYQKVLTRINQYMVLIPPKNVPLKEINMREYWIQK